MILLIIYLLSIILLKIEYRLCSSKYYNIWLDENCKKIEWFWFIPLVNTISVVLIFFHIQQWKHYSK